MRRAPRVVAFAVGALALIVELRLAPFASSPIASAAPRRSITRCVRYRQTLSADRQHVELRLANRCGAALSCEVSWSVTCGEEHRPRTVVAVALEVGGSSEVTADPACEGDWEVAEVRWSCDAG
jgi:hypothetical protein